MIRPILGLLLLAFALPSAVAHHYSPIQPGALLGDPCTMNFVFQDPAGALYIGAAGHCVPEVGERVIAPGLGSFGTTVFWRDDSTNFTEPANATGPLMDFALVKVDADKQDLVEPALRFWGGPTGIEAMYAPGTPTLHYGQGLFWQATEPSRPRYGVLQERYQAGPFTDWYLASHAIMGGDSGSGLLTGNGKALGIIVTVAATFGNQPGVIGGPTVELILETLHEAGFDVEMATAPFTPVSDAAGWQQRLAEMSVHCQAQTTSDPQSPDGCIRQQYYSYHVLDEMRNATSWHLYPWGVMANDNPGACPEAPWYPTLMEHPCRTEIVVLDQSEAFWETRMGGLNLTMTWRDAEQDVDLYLFDSEGREVASSVGRSGTVESIYVPTPAPGQYRMIAVPVRYIETDLATLQHGDDAFEVFASLEHRPDPSPAAENDPRSTPALELALVALLLLGASWGARRNR